MEDITVFTEEENKAIEDQVNSLFKLFIKILADKTSRGGVRNAAMYAKVWLLLSQKIIDLHREAIYSLLEEKELN